MRHGERGAIKPSALRRLREKADVTPTELGAALGVSERTVTRWESGESRVSRRRLKAIMAALTPKSEATSAA